MNAVCRFCSSANIIWLLQPYIYSWRICNHVCLDGRKWDAWSSLYKNSHHIHHHHHQCTTMHHHQHSPANIILVVIISSPLLFPLFSDSQLYFHLVVLLLIMHTLCRVSLVISAQLSLILHQLSLDQRSLLMQLFFIFQVLHEWINDFYVRWDELDWMSEWEGGRIYWILHKRILHLHLLPAWFTSKVTPDYECWAFLPFLRELLMLGQTD